MTTLATSSSAAWLNSESGFDSADQTRLFYRCWQPIAKRAEGAQRALIFLHRGHEHSGRIQPLVEQFGFQQDWAFAWDARGHGYSPGERGDAPSFELLVQDFNAFIAYIQQTYHIEPENMLIVANSVGAVIAATWLHDYAPKVRGVIMAAAAFEIKLYIPFAKAGLRLATCFKPDLFVTSYIRSSMLTHSKQQAAQYDQDPLIAKSISARVLLGLADTAKRIVHDASAIDVPVLMLAAENDYVVALTPQRQFFDRLASPLKRFELIKNCFHAIFYEQEVEQAMQASRQFINDCFELPAAPVQQHHKADSHSASAQQFQALQQGELGSPLLNMFYGMQKMMLGVLGPLSDGMKIGLTHGFDSGSSLDYVYRNQAGGRLGIGKSIDRGYLDAIGWRGIRQRKIHLQQALSKLIAQHPQDQPLRILDIAAGGGRYVLETIKRFQDREIQLTLRDFVPENLEQAKQLATHLHLTTPIQYQCRDAFSSDSYPESELPYDIVIVSGLYELFSENAPIMRSLQGIRQQLKKGGHVIYTGQPWHPQLLLIAKTLNNHLGESWQMRPRPQVEMDALVAAIGCRKVHTQIGISGIFTVSVAQFGGAVD
ncbi:bifunctional alpha/beta hydrolase/class I SAM-dependent methyltransferase [Solimicrobium silvestre]|uniref:Putative methyltransferase n=1 Tax=Solimicrobium silvestre TaxID=2099400 RepID=A0A2S9H110_9BURK|nr:bifunctional alpha/beta hydrolase/class I SAM-dependent methyltransferase [Solimicrobium silvestre]PRC93675.1 putative methyltransferase [Solimicrobium silvestre]